MGVLIYPCKIKEKVSGLVSNEEIDALYEKYDALKEEIVVLEHTNEYYNFVSPFEDGVYTCDRGHTDLDMGYGTYGDFLQGLDNLSDEEDVDCYFAFSTTISASGVDNCISYKVAEKMLEEFKQWEIQANKYFLKYDDDYGEFLWNIYKRYMEVLQECVELKGIVRYN